MEKINTVTAFQKINNAYNTVFKPGRLSVGLVVPIEDYPSGPVPEMTHHLERVQLAEELGFSSVWLRDVPFNDPSFGDAGQTFDPFVYLGFLAAQTSRIALGVASIILPLRHPAHIAKAAATTDLLSGGRLLLGIASGARPSDYPAMNQPFTERGQRFQDSVNYIRRMNEDFPNFENFFGNPVGTIDMLPKAQSGKLPLLITGGSQQPPEWIAENGDGWMIYPRNPVLQSQIVRDWQNRVEKAGRPPQPIMQPLYIDLLDTHDAPPQPIHLGMRLGTRYLRAYLKSLEEVGINHIALNLRFNQRNIEQTLHHLAEEILPDFAE